MNDVRPDLYGINEETRIVAVEPAGPASVRIYTRGGNDVIAYTVERAYPWLVTSTSALSQISQHHRSGGLDGNLPLDTLVRFPEWDSFRAARATLRQSGAAVYARPTLVDQFLLISGVTLFKDLEFDEILRLQLDIETNRLDPNDPEAVVLLVALRTNRGYEDVLIPSQGDQRGLLLRLNEVVRQLDPDIIEGHNLFQFDLQFLLQRARIENVSLDWGRDGSPVRTTGDERFRAGPRSVPFPGARVYGRHLLDTYHQVQRYDTAGLFLSYGLKQSARALGIERVDREFVEGSEISMVSKVDPERLTRYAMDDVRDVAGITEITALTDFYQTQMVPRTFQDIAIGGPGEKVNLLLARAYLAARHSLPTPGPASDVSGGLTEVRHIGVFRPVVKCDVESLYPAIMLADRIRPEADQLGIFLQLLDELTNRRLDAKREYQRASGESRQRWNGVQSSFKVLINSFYGYLGYSRALFNDFRAADRITRRGQELIRHVVAEIETRGATPIEIDTDGVYFQPPRGIGNEQQEIRFIDEVGATLPEGINLAHDGSFTGMISLKVKNYALMTHNGEVVLKGSSLRSRRDEPILRSFVEDAVRHFIEGEDGAVRARYFATARAIREGQFQPEEISRTESITEKTFTSAVNRRLAQAAADTPEGERVRVYERADGTLGLLSEYADDANIAYILRRLHDTAQRFAPLFNTDREFQYAFPLVMPNTDIDALEASPPVEQLNLFG
jgi:DNA polymerase, archaea type